MKPPLTQKQLDYLRWRHDMTFCRQEARQQMKVVTVLLCAAAGMALGLAYYFWTR